jgi:hypothetical protein
MISPDLQGTISTNPVLIKALTATAPKDNHNSMNTLEASIHMLNLSGRDINLFWVHHYDGSLVPMSDAPIRPNDPGAYFTARVFHQFLVMPACDDYQCHQSSSINPRSYFRVTDREIGESSRGYVTVQTWSRARLVDQFWR